MDVWMILDAARDDRIYGAVDGCHLEKCCLYSGDLPWQLQMAAPYLVQLDKEDRFTDYAIRYGWGNAWGIFLRTETSMKSLRRHLRGFLRVRDESGRNLIFRYYDPRVMGTYLPTCRRDELRTVFGPISSYLFESDDPGTLLEYGFDGNVLSESRTLL
jgi:hypothetical protein